MKKSVFQQFVHKNLLKPSSHSSRCENTFKLEPSCNELINSDLLKSQLSRLLSSLSEIKYDPKTAAATAKQLSAKVVGIAKCCSSDRFKHVVHVAVGEKCNGEFIFTSGGLKDDRFDGYVTEKVETANLFICVTLYSLYTE